MRIIVGALVVIASLLSLNGCAAGVVAMQAVPMAVGTVALANADPGEGFAARDTRREWTADQISVLDAYQRRAECGEASSQFWLASALRNDFNATPNNVEAYKWYRLAEMGDHEPAGAERAALATRMTQPQIAQANTRVRLWQPSTEGCPPDLAMRAKPSVVVRAAAARQASAEGVVCSRAACDRE